MKKRQKPSITDDPYVTKQERRLAVGELDKNEPFCMGHQLDDGTSRYRLQVGFTIKDEKEIERVILPLARFILQKLGGFK